jgi:hypothetical protein
MQTSTKLSTLWWLLPALAGCGAQAGSPSTVAPQSAITVAPDRQDDRECDEHEGPRHIFYIMMENHGTSEIVGNTADAPFINQLVSKAGVANNYFGVTHPSLPNYLAAVSGNFQGIWDDCAAGAAVTCAPEEFVPNSGDATSSLLLTPDEVASATKTPHWFDGKNIIDQIEDSGRTWKAYMQSIPSVGSTVEYAPTVNTANGPVTVKLYAQKHDPFMYFTDIRNNPDRMARIVGLDQFEKDIAGDDDETPNFVWISPDQCHDMHGVSPANAALIGLPSCGYPDSGLDHGAIQLGDAFLKETVSKIFASKAWKRHNSVLVIVWDEDDYAGYAGCCGSPTTTGNAILGGANAPALVVTSRHAKHRVSTKPYNHYSLLGTIQRAWDLDCLANTCNFDDSELMLHLFRP